MDDFLDLVVAHEARRAALTLVVAAFLVAPPDGLRGGQRFDVVVVMIIGVAVVGVGFVRDDTLACDRQCLRGRCGQQRRHVRPGPRFRSRGFRSRGFRGRGFRGRRLNRGRLDRGRWFGSDQ